MSILVGRDAELAALLDGLEDAEGGRARVLVCVGEPGIGKTRLADELTGVARSRGVVVAWGRAVGTDGGPPYRLWAEVITALEAAGLADSHALAALRAMTGERSVEERLRWFDDVTAAVLAAARTSPLVVVLDDADAADIGSQLLARHLARTARDEQLLVVVTCRETSGPLSELPREPQTRQLELRGLSQAGLQQQVASIAGREPTDAELTLLMEATAGNPFLAAELARQLADHGDLSAVPRSVRDSVRSRLSQLTPAASSALEGAAVIGVEFQIPLLAAMTERQEPAVLAALDEAAAAAFVTPRRQPGQWRFTHALIRDAIDAAMDTARRASLHRRAAEAIEAQCAGWEHTGHHDGAAVFALARHWAEAAVAGGSAPALYWTEQAGRAALRQHAYEDACRWFAQSLSLTRGSGADEQARSRLTLRLASAQALAADMPGALHSCQQVMGVAIRLGLTDLAAESALIVEPTFDPQIDRLIRDLCEQALDVLGPEQAGWRARVLAAYAVVCDHLSDIEEAERAVAEALSLVVDSQDVKALEAALVGHHMVRSGPDGLAEREATADRMAELGTRTRRPDLLLSAAEWRFDAACERGEIREAGREIEGMTRWATRIGGPISRWRVLRCRAVLAQAHGQLGEAQRYGAQALATVAATGHPPAFLLHGGFLAILGHHIGYPGPTLEALGMSEDPAEQDWPTEGIVMTLGPAAVLSDLGRIPEATRLYRRLGPASEWQETPHGALFTWAMGLLTATAVGADDDVTTLRDRLGAFRGHHIVNGRYAMAYLGPAELWLGIGATHLDLLDDAIADLEAATKSCAASGAEGFQAESEYELARALTRRGGPGDLSRARSLALDAQQRCVALGMPPIFEKASALLRHLDEKRHTVLTPREQQVAVLVAGGHTNREIAARLYISERTAQNHVQHVLDKLQVRNRSQIALWVQRSDLSTPAE